MEFGQPRPLTQEQVKTAYDWMHRRGVRQCPVCGTGDMLQVLPLLSSIPTQSVGEGLNMGQKYPCVSVVCLHCAHLMQLSAILIGIEEQQGGVADA